MARYTSARPPAASKPIFSEPARNPIPPPMASDPPISARSSPVIAPSASSTITHTMPPIISSQFTHIPTEILLTVQEVPDDNIALGSSNDQANRVPLRGKDDGP